MKKLYVRNDGGLEFLKRFLKKNTYTHYGTYRNPSIGRGTEIYAINRLERKFKDEGGYMDFDFTKVATVVVDSDFNDDVDSLLTKYEESLSSEILVGSELYDRAKPKSTELTKEG
jgi:hypothetical protein